MNNNLNYFFNEKSKDFLKKYLNTPSPVSFEEKGQKIWKDYIKSYVDKFELDIYGTAVGIINSNKSYKVVIEAHVDEISWYINYISHEGFLYVERNGGSDHQIAPSKKVCIHTEKGIIYGVFGWPAIHTRNFLEEKNTNENNLFVDIGASSKKEVEKLGVHVGCIITYPDKFFILNNKYFVCKALDNKIGGFILAEIARTIKKKKIKFLFSLYLVNSVQEEVGLRGAKMISHKIRPNVAIITDVSHDTSTPRINKKIQGDIKCGLGPIISYSPSIQNNLRKLIIKTAIEKNITFQRLVSPIYTATDTDAFAYSNGGVVSALISLPLRYMHTTVEMVKISDVKNVINLFIEILKKIQNNQNFKYF